MFGLARQPGTGGFMQNQARFLQTFCDFYVQICVWNDIYGLKMLQCYMLDRDRLYIVQT